MSLRRQLLLVSLLLIALPWAGCQYVREMEGALQAGQEQALLATTRAVATLLGNKPELLYPTPGRWQDDSEIEKQLYAIAGSAPVIVDGYADSWAEPVHGTFGPVRYRAQTRGALLYLLIEVRDENVVYHDPRQTRRASGDRLVLKTGQGRYLIATGAPGPVQARVERNGGMGWEPRIRGQWQDSLEGFTIELGIPLRVQVAVALHELRERQAYARGHRGRRDPILVADQRGQPLDLVEARVGERALGRCAELLDARQRGREHGLERSGWLGVRSARQQPAQVLPAH